MKLPNIDEIWMKDPKLAECLVALGLAHDTMGQKLTMNPQGTTNAPAPPSSIAVTANASGIHRVSITDSNPRTRQVHYFIEHSTDPSFISNVQTEHLGVGRQRSLAQSMGKTPVYYRAYAMYPDSQQRSDIVYFGSQQKPIGVVDHATTVGPSFHPTVGSGTSSTAGHGFGRENFVSSPTLPGKPPKVFE